MRSETSLVFLQHGSSRGSLQLKRTPTYLRFVTKGTDWKTLDALDQLDDEPASDERVLVAKKKRDETYLHLDYTDKAGRRRGRTERMVTYVLVPDQPPQDLLRDTDRWREWCLAQVVKIES